MTKSRIDWISLEGQQGEPGGMMTVSAHMSDGRSVVLIEDNGNVISHTKNVADLSTFDEEAPYGWVCWNSGPDGWFWSDNRESLKHELSENIRPATMLEKALLTHHGTKFVMGEVMNHEEEITAKNEEIALAWADARSQVAARTVSNVQRQVIENRLMQLVLDEISAWKGIIAELGGRGHSDGNTMRAETIARGRLEALKAE